MSKNVLLQDLNDLLNIAKNSPFYEKRLPSKPLINMLDFKNIPLTTKENIRDESPFGLICTPKDELVQYHESSGTTGLPVSSWFTKEDIYYNSLEIASCGINFNESDTVLVRFPYALSAAAHMIHSAAQLKNACVIPASGRTPTTPFPRIVDLMKRLNVTILSCLSLQAIMVAEAAEHLNLDPKTDFPSLRAICTAGESLSPARKKLLEEIWGVPIFEFYGMTEIGTAAVDCQYGCFHVLDNYFIVEILDESLTQDVPIGEKGQLVITPLKKVANPMVRYLTGDMARLITNHCRCGREQTIEIRGRKSEQLQIEGKTLDLWDLEEIISNLPCKRFWCAYQANNTIHLIIEKEKDHDVVTKELIEQLKTRYKVELKIKLVPKGTIYNREKLFTTGLTSKPKYIYSYDEINEEKHLHH